MGETNGTIHCQILWLLQEVLLWLLPLHRDLSGGERYPALEQPRPGVFEILERIT